ASITGTVLPGRVSPGPSYRSGALAVTCYNGTVASEVTAELVYTIDTGVKPVNETFGANDLQRRDTGETERRPMRIRNGRVATGLSFEDGGFVLVDHARAVANFYDKPRLPADYYPEVEALVKQVSGATRVLVFDYPLRWGDDGEREQHQVREP